MTDGGVDLIAMSLALLTFAIFLILAIIYDWYRKTR